MAAASPVCQELAGKSESEAENGEKKQADDDGSEPAGEVQDKKAEDKNPIHDDEMDFIVDDGKVLAKALKVARSLGSREDPLSKPEPAGEVQDKKAEDKNPIHDDEMDFIVDDGKVLAKALKVARSLGSREDPLSKPEPTGEVQDKKAEDKNPIHDDEMDFIVDDGKVLAKALKVARSLGSREDPVSQEPALVSAPLSDMFAEIVESQVPIRSQQIGEPEFTHEQKMAMLLDLYKTKPLIFLERFRKVLKEEHLESFSHLSGDYTADFYFKEIRKASRRKSHHTRVRNKRYAALQQLISDGEYFSDEQMRARDPLMYEHYVGQYQSEEEIMSQNSREMAQASCLSDVLLDSCQEQSLQRKLEAQREMEHNCEEEEEEEEEEDDDNEEEDSELQSDEEQGLANEERALMREEFVSRMHQRFLDGKDRDFDYSEVDDNPEFDNLDIVNRDEEERYFDDDDEGIDEMEGEED